MLGWYYTTRKVVEVNAGFVLTVTGTGPHSLMGSRDVEETFRHLKECMSDGGWDFEGLVGVGELSAGCLFLPAGKASAVEQE